MKKLLVFLVVVGLATGANVIFRLYDCANASGDEGAALEVVLPGDNIPREKLPSLPRQDAAALVVKPAAPPVVPVDALKPARTALQEGDRLVEQSRQAATPAVLLSQAAERYRECLALEESAPAKNALFNDARSKLERIERLLSKGGISADEPPPVFSEPLPVPVPAQKQPAAQNTPKKQAPVMVGPDGVPIRPRD